MSRWFLCMVIAICMPTYLSAQSIMPDWTMDGYRDLKYPNGLYYTGFVVERISADASLADELKRVEDAARSSMAESIIVHIQSNAQLITQRESQQLGSNFSEQIVSSYKQQISTSTNAKTAGVEVRSFYDPSSNMGYAFAFVEKAKLGEYYKTQIELLLQKTESILEAVDDLVGFGKKIAAKEKCTEGRLVLDEIEQFRMLYSTVAGADDVALQTDKYTSILRMTEQKILMLEQSTRVYVSCVWNDKEHPEYEGQAVVIEDLVKQSLSQKECNIVDDSDSADYVLTMTASTSQRSDGSDAYGIISYYANVQGILKNCSTDKTVASFAILNDPHAYSAGKTDAVAISKAFKLQSLQDVILNAIMPRIKN